MAARGTALARLKGNLVRSATMRGEKSLLRALPVHEGRPSKDSLLQPSPQHRFTFPRNRQHLAIALKEKHNI